MRSRLAVGLIVLALAGGAGAQPVSVLAIRHGYALPSDNSPAARPLPRAYPPTRPQLYLDLDLPLPDDYQDEVLRYTVTGVVPTLVVQFAVVKPGQPVQVLVERATGGHPKDATRAFGQIDWSDFERLKGLALPPLLAPPATPSSTDDGASGDMVITAVEKLCFLEYAGGGLSVRRSINCEPEGAALTAREALLETGLRAVGPAR